MCHRSQQSGRKAITLIEVLLVLALLVMLASMTWPALDRPMANQRLRKAADTVRTAWARARVDAMSTGQTYIFRCTLEEDQYTIESQAGPESVDSITSSVSGVFDDTGTDSTAMNEPLSSTKFRLPNDIRFVDEEVAYDTRAEILGQSAQTATDASTTDTVDPILFFPDGTTSTAKLILENQYQRRIDLSLRGLTGIMTVSDTYTAEDTAYASQN